MEQQRLTNYLRKISIDRANRPRQTPRCFPYLFLACSRSLPMHHQPCTIRLSNPASSLVPRPWTLLSARLIHSFAVPPPIAPWPVIPSSKGVCNKPEGELYAGRLPVDAASTSHVAHSTTKGASLAHCRTKMPTSTSLGTSFKIPLTKRGDHSGPLLALPITMSSSSQTDSKKSSRI